MFFYLSYYPGEIFIYVGFFLNCVNLVSAKKIVFVLDSHNGSRVVHGCNRSYFADINKSYLRETICQKYFTSIYQMK